MTRRTGILLAAVAAVVALHPPAAYAEDPLPAIAQYVESMPSASGPVRRDRAGAGVSRRPSQPLLSPTAESHLRSAGGRDAVALRRIATNPSLGAPQRRLVEPKVRRGAAVRVETRGPNANELITALNPTRGHGKRLPVVLVALVMFTPLLFIVGRRRRSRIPNPS
jgi:hypothetical protein